MTPWGIPCVEALGLTLPQSLLLRADEIIHATKAVSAINRRCSGGWRVMSASMAGKSDYGVDFRLRGARRPRPA